MNLRSHGIVINEWVIEGNRSDMHFIDQDCIGKILRVTPAVMFRLRKGHGPIDFDDLLDRNRAAQSGVTA